MIERPREGEYAEYQIQYIELVPEGDVLQALESQIGETRRFLEQVGEEKSLNRYAPGKWSIRQIVGHLSDTERVLSYRALRFSRNDSTSLPGFEQDDYVRYAESESRSLGALLDELTHVRRASLDLFRSMSSEMLARKGTASGYTLSVRAIPYVIAGHELHHRRIIQEKYL